jgi:hypothetical protein
VSYIDVLIPGVIGVLLLASPWYSKNKGMEFRELHQRRQLLGTGLVATAIVYLALKLARQR